MKIFRKEMQSGTSQFKKPRNAFRPYEFVDLLKKTEDDYFTEEDSEYIRRYKREKDGQKTLLYQIRKDYTPQKDSRNELMNRLNAQPRKTVLQ